jgi:hypothetical protein
MIQGKTRRESIELTAKALGISEVEAEFIVAIELGEISGDIIVLDDQGNERPPAPPQDKTE